MPTVRRTTLCFVTGTAADPRNTPVRDYQVVAFSTTPALWFERFSHMAAARARSDGTFRLTTLPPGDYSLVALPTGSGVDEWRRADVLRELVPLARRMTLVEGESQVFTLSLSAPP